jgi:hypothetical protein
MFYYGYMYEEGDAGVDGFLIDCCYYADEFYA